jgi:hypothetical protein
MRTSKNLSENTTLWAYVTKKKIGGSKEKKINLGAYAIGLYIN